MDILIRNVPDDVAAALTTHSQAAGMDRQAWILDQWQKLKDQPVVKQQYRIRCYGPDSAYCQIHRFGDGHSTGGGAKSLNQSQMDAYKRASDYAMRNHPGDREKAISLLQSQFEEVFEVPA